MPAENRAAARGGMLRAQGEEIGNCPQSTSAGWRRAQSRARSTRRPRGTVAATLRGRVKALRGRKAARRPMAFCEAPRTSRKAQRGRTRPREARRGPARPGEVPGGPERSSEAPPRGSARRREPSRKARRGPAKPRESPGLLAAPFPKLARSSGASRSLADVVGFFSRGLGSCGLLVPVFVRSRGSSRFSLASGGRGPSLAARRPRRAGEGPARGAAGAPYAFGAPHAAGRAQEGAGRVAGRVSGAGGRGSEEGPAPDLQQGSPDEVARQGSRARSDDASRGLAVLPSRSKPGDSLWGIPCPGEWPASMPMCPRSSHFRPSMYLSLAIRQPRKHAPTVRLPNED